MNASAAARVLAASSANTKGEEEGIGIGSVNVFSLNGAIGSDNLWLIRPNIPRRSLRS
jgi:hypothetical protein